MDFNSTLDSLDDMGYSGDIATDEALNTMCKLGPLSAQYTELVSNLINQLCAFYKLEENVSALKEDNDSTGRDMFIMELNGFLREFKCPHSQLTSDLLTHKLEKFEDSKLLLDYLLSEVQAAQINSVQKTLDGTETMDTSDQVDGDSAGHLKNLVIELGYPKPPASITPFLLFTKLEARIKDLIIKHPSAIGEPLLKSALTPTQWDRLNEVNESLTSEYQMRREMLIKRLDVTVQSFMWSDKIKAKQDDATRLYQPLRVKLKIRKPVTVVDILVARDDLTSIEKTDSKRQRRGTSCAINKIVMGDVPDRGGRTVDSAAPRPDMPYFKKRVAGGDAPQQQRQYSGKGRGGRGGRGGRVQGSWSADKGGRRYK